MASPSCVVRMLTSRRLWTVVRVQCYSKQLALKKNTPKKRNKPKSGLDPKQNPYIPYVEGDPVQQARVMMVDSSSMSNKDSANEKQQRANTQPVKHLQPIDKGNEKQQRANTQPVKHLQPIDKGDEKKPKPKKKKRKNAKTSSQTDLLRQVSTSEPNNASENQEEAQIMIKDGIKYTCLTAQSDRRIVGNMMRVSTERMRETNKEILVQGVLDNIEVMQAGMKPYKLFFTSPYVLKHVHRLVDSKVFEKAEIYKVPSSMLRTWTSTTKVVPAAGIYPMPEPGTELNSGRPTIPVTLVCDSIRRSNCLGTLIHAAVSIGCQQVLMINGCLDVWHPDVLVDSKCTHFNIPIRQHLTWSQALNHLPSVDKNFYLVGTSNEMEAKIRKESEHLNISEEIDREREAELFGDSENDTKTSKTSSYESSENDNELVDSDMEVKEVTPKIYERVTVNVQSYCDIDYTLGHAVIVVSGRPDGPFRGTRKVFYDNFGVGVDLPKIKGGQYWVSGIAGSVTLVEVAQQFKRKGYGGKE